jgi:hypothetical protein
MLIMAPIAKTRVDKVLIHPRIATKFAQRPHVIQLVSRDGANLNSAVQLLFDPYEVVWIDRSGPG